MNENEPTNQRPFRRCLDTWPEGMGVDDDVAPMSIPDHWLRTKPELPHPWDGAFLRWQEEFKNHPRQVVPKTATVHAESLGTTRLHCREVATGLI